jgi:tetratricopeptide (TPR) repeat protein
MPRSAAVVLAVAALVAAGALALQVLPPGPSPIPATTDPGSDAATRAALRDLAGRLDRIEQEVFQPRLAPGDPAARLADLEERLHALEQRPAGRQAAAGTDARDDPAGAATADAPLVVDVGSLSDEDLIGKARSLAGKRAYDAAAPFWREVLERGPSDEVFVEAQIHLGYALREAKDHEREEAAFREALRVAGSDTEQGQKILFQLAWTRHFQGDYASSRDLMVAVANAPASPRALTGHARLHVAYLSLQLDDGDRARETLESMVRDFGGSAIPIEAWLARQATERLAQLK